MKINTDSIISSENLGIDASKINQQLTQNNELVVFENNQPQFVILSLQRYDALCVQSADTLPYQSCDRRSTEKIGKYVQDTMRELSSSNTLTSEDLQNLLSEDYCSRVFGISYPVLRSYDPLIPLDKQKRDARGYSRYYNYTLHFFSADYLLCSQWVERLHRSRYEDWLGAVKKEVEHDGVH